MRALRTQERCMQLPFQMPVRRVRTLPSEEARILQTHGAYAADIEILRVLMRVHAGLLRVILARGLFACAKDKQHLATLKTCRYRW